MRCRICGKPLEDGEADVCKDCYQDLMNDKPTLKEESKGNEKLLFEITNKYSISYEFLKNIEIFFLVVIALVGCFVLKNKLESVICLIVVLLVYILFLVNDKLRSGNVARFYETKLHYSYKNIFITNEKDVEYANISDIKVYQTIRQRMTKRGDLCIYASGKTVGKTTINGIEFKDLANAKVVYESLMGALGMKEGK